MAMYMTPMFWVLKDKLYPTKSITRHSGTQINNHNNLANQDDHFLRASNNHLCDNEEQARQR
jgi:hypothetical protein